MIGLYWNFILNQLHNRVSKNNYTLIAMFMPLIQLPLMYSIGGLYGNIIGAVLVAIQLVCGIIGFLKD